MHKFSYIYTQIALLSKLFHTSCISMCLFFIFSYLIISYLCIQTLVCRVYIPYTGLTDACALTAPSNPHSFLQLLLVLKIKMLVMKMMVKIIMNVGLGETSLE